MSRRGTAKLQAMLAVRRSDGLREEAAHIERNLGKWHFDRTAKEKLKKIADSFLATVEAYEDFRRYMAVRSEHCDGDHALPRCGVRQGQCWHDEPLKEER